MEEEHLRYLLAGVLVAVAAFGVYAGLAEQGADPPAATGTEMPMPTETPAPTTTSGPPEEIAPGLTWDGILDSQRLDDAHASQLRTTSYTLVDVAFTWNDSQSSPSRIENYAQVDGDEVLFVYEAAGRPGQPSSVAGDVTIWHNESVSYTRWTGQGGNVSYWRDQPESDMLRGTPGRENFVLSTFSQVDVTTVEEIDRGDTTLYRVVSTSQPGTVDSREVSNYSLVALIDSNGLIHRFQESYEYEEDGSTHYVSRTWQLQAVGNTTVERPAWVEVARNETDGS